MKVVNTLMEPEIYYQKIKMRFAVQGLFLAWISSITAVTQGNINGMVNLSISPSFLDTSLIIIIISLAILAFNDIIAGIWILIYNIITGRSIKEYFRVSKTKSGAMMLLASFFGGPFATGAWMAAVNFCGLTYTLTIMSTTSLVTAIVGRIVFKEQMNLRIIIGIIIAVFGIALTSFSPPSGDVYPQFYLGIFLAALSPIGFTIEGMLSTYSGDVIDPMVGSSLYRGIGSGIMGFIVITILGVSTSNGLVGWSVIGEVITTPSAFIWVLIMGLCGGISYATCYDSFNKTGPTRTLAIINTTPVWSIPIGFGFALAGLYDYAVTLQAIVAAFVVIVGITLVIAKPSELLNLRDTEGN
ncbi:DMT family transporter [Bacillus salipaludis]|uniref:DMT family transporter n=1 Tax=Bacillus salipaludis TaxID=2547811 RepID=A0ABW8RBX4_9BACI